ncbi:MAG: hypothetical protein P4M07_08410 [Xanthobacteraceae bacterium]|nr:hypothetical protein [Xanthobacteraceae bacterium]
MAHFIFRCPATRLNVQHWRPETAALRADDGAPETYEAVTCPACTKLHFLSHRTGKLLGQEDA